MPWQRGGTRPVLPTNVLTGHAYRGVNILSLWITAMDRGYASGEWATLRQWNEKGACVRKGEKASAIVFYKEITVASAAEPDTGACETEQRRLARGYWVFAAEQVDGYQPIAALPPNPIARIAAAEAFLRQPEPGSSLVARRLAIARPPTASICRTRRGSSMAMAARARTPGMRC
jgi:antirestriction protein ArdC